MQVTVTGRHMGISDRLKEYCEEKAVRLARYYDRIRLVEVVLDGQHGSHSAEMIVHTDRTQPFVAREQHTDVYAAVDILLDKIERQISDHKKKLRNRKHPPRGSGEGPAL